MAKDDDERTPADDELARRRQERQDAGEPDPPEGEPQSLAGLADAGTGEEDDGQLFVWEQGRKVTLGTIIARGTVVEHAFVFGGKRLKGRGGLIGMDEDVLVIARGRLGVVSLVPTRDDDERVTKVTIVTAIATKVVTPADSDEGEAIMRQVLDARAVRAAKAV